MSEFKNLSELKKSCALHGIEVDWIDDVLVFNFPNRDELYYARMSESKPLGATQTERTCIVVLGVPRSGTSCIAGVLHHLGVRMGPFDTTVDESNPSGYFEHKDLVGFHGQIVGRGLESWRSLDDRFVLDDEVKQIYHDLIRFSEDAVGERGLWGFKDMRVCQVVEEFAAAVSSRVKMVEVVRDPGAVRRSMLAYPGFEEQHPGEVDEVMQKWNELKFRAVAALTALLGAPRLVLSYEWMVAEPERTVRELAAYVGVEPTEAAVGFVRPELNRQGGEE